jgi:hypothetical protein
MLLLIIKVMLKNHYSDKVKKSAPDVGWSIRGGG